MTSKPTISVLRDELKVLYNDLAHEVAEAGPTCVLSGRCCRFGEYGHTLFLSGPEATILLADAPEPAGPVDDPASCPWQNQAGHCTAREARPLGCRVYYCDETYQEKSHVLSETYLARLRDLADRLDLAWNYAPLHAHLKNAGLDRPRANR